MWLHQGKNHEELKYVKTKQQQTKQTLKNTHVHVLQLLLRNVLECRRKTVDFPAPHLSVPRVAAELVNNTQISADVRRLSFEMTGG